MNIRVRVIHISQRAHGCWFCLLSISVSARSFFLFLDGHLVGVHSRLPGTLVYIGVSAPYTKKFACSLLSNPGYGSLRANISERTCLFAKNIKIKQSLFGKYENGKIMVKTVTRKQEKANENMGRNPHLGNYSAP